MSIAVIFYFFKVGNTNLENVSHEEAVATLKATSDHVKLVVVKQVYDEYDVGSEPLPPPPPPPPQQHHTELIRMPTPPRTSAKII